MALRKQACWEDKVLKSILASRVIWRNQDMKTVRVLREDKERSLGSWVPVGVIAGLIPSTNPTSTVMYKALIALRRKQYRLLSSPKYLEVWNSEIIKKAAKSAGCRIVPSVRFIAYRSYQWVDATQDTIWFGDWRKYHGQAAYSSDTPKQSIVGPGKWSAFIEKEQQMCQKQFVNLDSKTFDNGVICASEQSIIVEEDEGRLAEFRNKVPLFGRRC